MTQLTSELAAAAVLLAAAAAAFSTRPILRRYRAASDKVSGSIRIAHLSDLHNCRYGKGQERLIRMLEKSRPELIVMTGDMIDDDEAAMRTPVLTESHPVRPLIEAAVSMAPTFAVFGNHERSASDPDGLAKELEALGVHILRGEWERISLPGGNVTVAGIDDPRFFGPAKPKLTLAERRADDADHDSDVNVACRAALAKLAGEASIAGSEDFTLLLAHRPEMYECYASLGFDAAMSGHAHGGQVRIPFLMNGLYAPHQGFFPRHAGGRYPVGRMIHIVSRGLAKHRAPRIFNRPEICLLEVYSGVR